VPELFRNKDEFDAYVRRAGEAGVNAGLQLRVWSMPASLKHPTLECARRIARRWWTTRLRSRRWALAGAAARPQSRAQSRHQRVTRAIVVETNGARQRYGVHGTLVGDNGAIHGRGFVDQVVDETSADATRSAASPNCSAAAPSSAPHLGRRPDGGVREVRQDRRPRPRARAVTAGSRRPRCSDRYASSGRTVCTTKPRARASTTPSRATRTM